MGLQLSPQGIELVGLYSDMVEHGYQRNVGPNVEKGKVYNSFELRKFRNIVRPLLGRSDIKTVLDYGGGGSNWDAKGFEPLTEESAKEFFQLDEVHTFEPARSLIEKKPADCVVCMDVLEHIFLTDIPKDSISNASIFFRTDSMKNFREISLANSNGLYRFEYDPHQFPGIKIEYFKDTKPIATRKSSEIFLKNVAKFPNLIGGSADLAGSNNTKTKDHKIIKPGNFSGNYIHYGVREHAMCGIMNGIALHSSLIPYGGTFLIFSDYCKPSIRLAAMMKQRVIYIFTHDSIGLGEDGPTHQPIEQLTSLRSIPNLNVFRPSDTIETFECWQLALESKNTPSVISLTRQGVSPVRLKNSYKNESSFGAYEILRTGDNIRVTILATGSETSLANDVGHKLATDGIYSKIISMPCQKIFDHQSEEYKKKILGETELLVSIEASETNYWKKYTGTNGLNFGINDFGKSAPYKKIYDHFKLNTESIVKKIKEKL